MNKSEIILYQTKDSDITMDVLVENETVWLTQSQMGVLFGRNRTVINKHISNVFDEGELDEKVSCANFAHDTQHGAIEGKMKTSYTNLYNLDVIISVGYRVKSNRGTEFRIWANKVLKNYILKGYAVNDKLKLQQYGDFKQTVKLLSNVIQNNLPIPTEKLNIWLTTSAKSENDMNLSLKLLLSRLTTLFSPNFIKQNNLSSKQLQQIFQPYYLIKTIINKVMRFFVGVDSLLLRLFCRLNEVKIRFCIGYLIAKQSPSLVVLTNKK